MGALGNTVYQRQAGEKAMATDEKHTLISIDGLQSTSQSTREDCFMRTWSGHKCPLAFTSSVYKLSKFYKFTSLSGTAQAVTHLILLIKLLSFMHIKSMHTLQDRTEKLPFYQLLPKFKTMQVNFEHSSKVLIALGNRSISQMMFL